MSKDNAEATLEKQEAAQLKAEEEAKEKAVLSGLKSKAKALGVAHSPNISAETLSERIKEKVAELEAAEQPEPVPEVVVPETPQRRRVRLRREAAKLVRIRVTCMNPAKREWQGELFSVGNTAVGDYRRMVPFGVEWHVEQIMLNMIQERKYQMFRTLRNAQGETYKEAEFVKEFAVEILPALTPTELKALAQRQAMAAGTEAQ